MNAHANPTLARGWPEPDVLRIAVKEAGFKIDVVDHAAWLTEPGKGHPIHCLDEGHALRMAFSLIRMKGTPEPQARVVSPAAEASTQTAAPAAP